MALRALLMSGLAFLSGGAAAAQGPGTVLSHQKISTEVGGFRDALDPFDVFGSAVAAIGDLDGNGVEDLVVSAPGDDDGVTNAGGLWVLFLAADGSIASRQKIANGQGGPPVSYDQSDEFGSSLASLGDLDGDGVGDLAVGAARDGSTDGRPGGVYVLFLHADGTVKANHRIADVPDLDGMLTNGEGFGSAVTALGDIDGDGVTDLAVGSASFDDTAFPMTPSCGAVWILLLEDDGSVKAHQRITNDEGGFAGVLRSDDSFGCALAGVGDLDDDGVSDLAVGAMGYDQAGHENRGLVWLLFLDGDGTVTDERMVPEGTSFLAGYTHFGRGLASMGDLDGDGVEDLAVGARGPDGDGVTGILFLGPDATVLGAGEVTNSGGEAGDEFGSAVAALGDLDGDGVGDLVVGAPHRSNRGMWRGSVWTVLLDSSAGAIEVSETTDDQAAFLGTVNTRFGQAVAGLGDLDRDGLAEVVVGGRGDEQGDAWLLHLDEGGTVASFHGLASELPDIVGEFEFDDFGGAVASLGDLDGNGVTDLAVGASNTPFGGPVLQRGVVWILFLDAQGHVLAYQRISAIEGGFTGDVPRFGQVLAALGDLDGDGTPDLAVGTRDAESVWILFLRPDGTVRDQREIGDGLGGFTGDLETTDEFGWAVAAIGDVDGDGVQDLAVGVPEEDAGGTDRGGVWILFLNDDGSVKSQREIDSTQGGFGGTLTVGDRFGSSVGGVGDLNGDGIEDLVVASEVFGGGNVGGRVWMLFLAADGSVASELEITENRGGFTGDLQSGDGFGSAVASVGDVDGDGVGDLVVGAMNDDDGGNGAVWLLHLDGVATLDLETADDVGGSALVNGQELAVHPTFGRSVAITSSGANLGATIFDSTVGGPNDPGPDPELLVGRGNVLVLQDSLAPTQTVAGVFDSPGDDPDGGTVVFTFPNSVELASIDLVDTDSARLTLFDSSGRTRSYSVPAGWTGGMRRWRTLDLTTLAPQLGANPWVVPVRPRLALGTVATAAQTLGFDEIDVVRLEVVLGGSGALDALRWDPHPGP